MAALAKTYGLLQLPKMPELKQQDVSAFTPSNVDTNKVPYKNKQQESARQEKLKKYKETGIWTGKKKKLHRKETQPWSKAKEMKEEKKEKRLKRKRRKEGEGEGKRKKRRKGNATIFLFP